METTLKKQIELALYEEPVLKMSDLEVKLKRVETVLKRVSDIPKPKEDKAKFKNVKIDNITIDGNSGDINWEDFIKINNGPDDNERSKETLD